MIKIKYILFLSSLLFVLSCNSGDDNKFLLEKEVDYKMQIHINKKLNGCRNNALEDAEVFVDSIITEITSNSIKNDLEFPERPGRDTSSENFNFKIDSMDIIKVVDSLNLLKDSTKQINKESEIEIQLDTIK